MYALYENDIFVDDYNFQYLSKDDLAQAIKKVRRKRLEKLEEERWKEFCREKELNSNRDKKQLYNVEDEVTKEELYSDEVTREKELHSDEVRIAQEDFCARKDLNSVTGVHNDDKLDLQEVCTKILQIALEKTENAVSTYAMAIDSTQTVNTDQDVKKTSLESSTVNKTFPETTNLNKTNTNCNEYISNEKLYNSDDCLSAHKFDVPLTSKSSSLSCDSNPQFLTFEDPLFKNKLKSVRSKIGLLLQEVNLPRTILEPNSPEEQLKLRKRDLEFYSRFSRNYLYELQRHITKFDKISSKKYQVLDKNVSQKVLSAHQLVLRGLQAYLKHVPTSLEERVPDRLRDLAKNFLKVTKCCIKLGIMDQDELHSDCQRLFQNVDNYAKTELHVPTFDCIKLKRVDSHKSQPKSTKSAMTTRTSYYSPYYQKQLGTKKKMNMKNSLQSINEHQVLKHRSAPVSKMTTNRSISAHSKQMSSGRSNIPLDVNLNLEPSRSQMNSPLAALSEQSSEGEVAAKIDKEETCPKVENEKIESIARNVVQETMKPFLKDLTLILARNKLLSAKEDVKQYKKPTSPKPETKSVKETLCIGDKNAKLFCIQSMDDTVEKPSTDLLKQTHRSRHRSKSALGKRSSSKLRKKSQAALKKRSKSGVNPHDSKDQDGVKLIKVPQRMLKNTLAYRKKFQNAKLNNPLYNKIWEKHPIEVIQTATEDVLQEALQGIMGELQLEDLLTSMIRLEFCPP